MAIEISCPGCGQVFRLRDHYAGRTVRCSRCQGPIQVPTDDDEYAMAEPEDSPDEPARSSGGLVRGRTERSYIHLRCRTETELDGPELRAVADPLARMVRTYCAECEEHFPMDQFAWSDTGEKISDYYRRYQGQVSPLLRVLASRLGMFLIAGGLAWFAFSGSLVFHSIWVLGAGLLLAVGSVAAHTLVLGPWILNRAFGTSDSRELN